LSCEASIASLLVVRSGELVAAARVGSLGIIVQPQQERAALPLAGFAPLHVLWKGVRRDPELAALAHKVAKALPLSIRLDELCPRQPAAGSVHGGIGAVVHFFLLGGMGRLLVLTQRVRCSFLAPVVRDGKLLGTRRAAIGRRLRDGCSMRYDALRHDARNRRSHSAALGTQQVAAGGAPQRRYIPECPSKIAQH